MTSAASLLGFSTPGRLCSSIVPIEAVQGFLTDLDAVCCQALANLPEPETGSWTKDWRTNEHGSRPLSKGKLDLDRTLAICGSGECGVGFVEREAVGDEWCHVDLAGA